MSSIVLVASTVPLLQGSGTAWAGLRKVIEREGAQGLTTRRGDTRATVIRRMVLLTLLTVAYLLIGGFVYRAFERDNELRTNAEYGKWPEAKFACVRGFG